MSKKNADMVKFINLAVTAIQHDAAWSKVIKRYAVN